MSLSSAPTVTRVELLQSRVPLPAPVTLGKTEISFRDYVSLRLVFSDGSLGFATGFERGMALFDIALRVLPASIGKQAALRGQVREAMLGPAPAARPVNMRAISLANIALWDAYCRQAGRPLWSILGAVRTSVPVMPVIGYGATPERIARQCAELADQGFRFIKIMIDGTDLATDVSLMRAAAESLPEGVSFGVDAHWSWRTPQQALPTCRAAEDFNAAFVEDPFAPGQWRAIAELQAQIGVPIAVGEDVVDRHGFRDQAEVAPILRPDATASGGIDGFLEVVALANTFDRSIIPHVFPAMHGHIAFASQTVTCVESILPEVGADPIDRFFTDTPKVVAGVMQASDQPGASTGLDWDRLTTFATRTETIA